MLLVVVVMMCFPKAGKQRQHAHNHQHINGARSHPLVSQINKQIQSGQTRIVLKRHDQAGPVSCTSTALLAGAACSVAVCCAGVPLVALCSRQISDFFFLRFAFVFDLAHHILLKKNERTQQHNTAGALSLEKRNKERTTTQERREDGDDKHQGRRKGQEA